MSYEYSVIIRKDCVASAPLGDTRHVASSQRQCATVFVQQTVVRGSVNVVVGIFYYVSRVVSGTVLIDS